MLDAWNLAFFELRPRLVVVTVLASLLPTGTCTTLRANLLRLVGFRVGPRSRLLGLPHLSSSAPRPECNLEIGADCEISWSCLLEIGEKISIGDGVRLGPETLIITSTHVLGPKEHRAGPIERKPVNIGNGVSLGARSVVLPGVTIGEGAQILAGSVVNKDVPPRTRWAGVPAKLLGPTEP